MSLWPTELKAFEKSIVERIVREPGFVTPIRNELRKLKNLKYS